MLIKMMLLLTTMSPHCWLWWYSIRTQLQSLLYMSNFLFLVFNVHLRYFLQLKTNSLLHCRKLVDYLCCRQIYCIFLHFCLINCRTLCSQAWGISLIFTRLIIFTFNSRSIMSISVWSTRFNYILSIKMVEI